MKLRKVESTETKLLLTGMITSDSFLKRILPVFEYDYLDLEPAKRVAKWVVEYYEKYNAAPKETISEIFKKKINTDKKITEDESKWLAAFIQQLSDNYADGIAVNEDYIFDTSVNFFRSQKLRKSISKIDKLLEDNKVEEAEELWKSSSILAPSIDLGIDPFDIETARQLLTQQDARLQMELQIDTLDNMLGPMKSGWFVVFMAGQKRGKTWFLMYAAIQALMQDLNVVFISLETEKEDNALRLWMSVGTMVSEDGTKTLRIPYFADANKTLIDYSEVKRPSAQSFKNVRNTLRNFGMTAHGKLVLKTFPMGQAKMTDIKRFLDSLEAYNGFTANVVIVDYLGIIQPPSGITGRDIYDYNCKELKTIAQEKKAIVYTGHQITRKALEQLNINPSDTPEDIRILGHVDVMLAGNQTDREMDEGVMRVACIEHRHHKFTRNKQAKVLQHYETGQFAIDDVLIDTPRFYDKKKQEETTSLLKTKPKTKALSKDEKIFIPEDIDAPFNISKNGVKLEE